MKLLLPVRSYAVSSVRSAVSCRVVARVPSITKAASRWHPTPLGAPSITPTSRLGPLFAQLSSASSSEQAETGARLEGEVVTVLYNTKARKKEVFEAKNPNTKEVNMYVCGVTVYDYSHIGHARVYTVFDVLFRMLKWRGFDVTYCRNFTDVDDKIIKRANEVGEECSDVTERFIAEFHEDMRTLGNLSPTMEPRATEHIGDMIEQIGKIIDNGHAYAVDGDVYFSVPSLDGYGSLSGRKMEDNRAGERVEVDSRKRDPADFALWKAKKEGEPFWESPWGQGRPGWHIECSAMIHKLLGEEIDIHGGGLDLTFPHHENELAQSMASCDQCSDQFSRFWVHNGFVNVNTEKMSKSLGNFFTIREILERYHPLALRFFLLNTHYRSSINFSDQLLDEASARAYYLYQTLSDCESLVKELGAPPAPSSGLGLTETSEKVLRECTAALCDDLGTQQALSALSPALKAVNELVHTKKGRKNPSRLEELLGLRAAITEVLGVLGLSCEDYGEVLDGMKQRALRRCGRTAKEVEGAIEARQEARKAKDFAESDRVRDELAADGIALLDTPQGTVWRPVSIQE